jgi:hypothetical protein
VLLIRRQILDRCLDRIQSRNPCQRLRRQTGRLLDLCNFEEASPAVRPTSNRDHAAGATQGQIATVSIDLQIAFVIGEKRQRMNRFARLGEFK